VVKRLGLLGGIGYIARGPILGDGQADQAESLMDQIHGWCRANRVRHLIVQAGEHAEAIEQALMGRDYIGNAPAVAPTATLRIDLRQSVDQILGGMSAARRRDLRLAERSGVTTRIGGDADLDVFCAMHEATAHRQDFAPLSRSYLRQQWSVLHPLGWLQLFIAHHEGKPIAGITVTAFGDRVTFRVAGWTGEAANLRSNAACHWSAIQWARRQGYRYYDFGDFDRKAAEALIAAPDAAGQHAQSPEAFKHRFGGELVLLPEPRQFTFNPVARAVTRAAFGRLAGRSSFRRFIHRFRNG
jgi:lipid II:glycine glycyltransferase (peptidoglycan interpeptide bridge formation enzyme)